MVTLVCVPVIFRTQGIIFLLQSKGSLQQLIDTDCIAQIALSQKLILVPSSVLQAGMVVLAACCIPL